MFGPHVDRTHAEPEDASGRRPSVTARFRACIAEAEKHAFDVRCFQVYVDDPKHRNVEGGRLDQQEEIPELRRFLDENRRLQAIAHGAFYDSPWSGKTTSIDHIGVELADCELAGISGLVVHLGKPGVEEVMGVLPKILASATTSQGVRANSTLIYLEVPCVKPENSRYETPEKLAELFRAIRRIDPTLCRFGLCIDTAHLWACGVDLQSFDSAEAWLRRLEAVAADIPPDRIMIHLNDSFEARGRGMDSHAPLLGGQIWGVYEDRPKQSGLAAFVDYIVRNGTMAILEPKGQAALLDGYAALGRLTAAVRFEGWK